MVLLFGSEAVEERQGERARGDGFRYGKMDGAPVGIGRLAVDGREVAGTSNAVGGERAEERVALLLGEALVQADDVDEPTDGGVGEIERGQSQREVRKALMIAARDSVAGGEDGVDTIELREAEGAGKLRQAVVVTKLGVLEPVVGRVAALIAQGADAFGERVVAGDDHSAFAGGDLLIGVEGEDGGVSEAADALVVE